MFQDIFLKYEGLTLPQHTMDISINDAELNFQSSVMCGDESIPCVTVYNVMTVTWHVNVTVHKLQYTGYTDSLCSYAGIALYQKHRFINKNDTMETFFLCDYEVWHFESPTSISLTSHFSSFIIVIYILPQVYQQFQSFHIQVKLNTSLCEGFTLSSTMYLIQGWNAEYNIKSGYLKGDGKGIGTIPSWEVKLNPDTCLHLYEHNFGIRERFNPYACFKNHHSFYSYFFTFLELLFPNKDVKYHITISASYRNYRNHYGAANNIRITKKIVKLSENQSQEGELSYHLIISIV